MKTSSWSDDLDPKEPAYKIAFSRNSRIRVLAGPGTGKSFAMKRRVARLLEDGVSPKKILPVTFTRVAAADLQRELIGMKVPNCDKLKATTLHSLALRILMRNNVLGVIDRIPRPLNAFEIEPLVCDLKDAHGGRRQVKKNIQAYEAAWARLQHDQPGYAPTPKEVEFQSDLVNWLVFHEAMLIGEVIPHLYKYLRSHPHANERTKYSHILVDEYQDLNRAEQAIIELLSARAEVCIVGDDDQSIYSFKHAHPEGIREWLKANPGAEDLSISDCRRCPAQIVDMANDLIGHNKQRSVKKRLGSILKNGKGDTEIIHYKTKDKEIAGVVNLVLQMIVNKKACPGDILILVQNKKFGTELYEALIEKDIPTKSYYAESELVHKDAQRAFALLKLLENRKDRVALRWLLGVDKSDWNARVFSRIREHCETNDVSLWEAMSQLDRGVLSLPYTSGAVNLFREILQELNNLEKLSLQKIVDKIFPKTQISTQEIHTLAIDILTDKKTDNLKEFVEELSIAISKPEIPTKIEDVRIMSLHKSKGLSSPVTVIAGCVQGLLPKAAGENSTHKERQRHLEEQRRLFYVGITRVKAIPGEGKPGKLILTYSQRMPPYDAFQGGISPAQTRRGYVLLHASPFIQNLGPKAPPPVPG